MFQDALRNVVDGTEGGVASLLMGFDGIPVEHYVREGAQLDVDKVGMEFSVILKDIRRAAEMLSAGTAREVSVQAEHLITVVRLLNDEYFLAVAVAPGGNPGKARFLMRTHAERFLRDLV
jgi:predicted regulator of Ras-like GTPase activity (Roadblock/LC7/MglB family)